MRDHGAESVSLRQLDRIERFGQGADLIELDQNRVARLFLDSARQSLGVGDIKIVADQLDAVRRSWRSVPVQVSQSSSARPSSIETIGYFSTQPASKSTISGRLRVRPSPFKVVVAVLEQLGGGGIERDHDVLARPVAGLLDRLDDQSRRHLRWMARLGA